jgi:phosphatidylinositol alpha-1,6-mannosyltransferase
MVSGQKLLLSVGRLTRRKGFDQMLHALATLTQSGHALQYAIVGIGDDRKYLHGLATQLGIDDRVHFLGHVPENDLPRWYNLATLFAMPNREIDGDTEGFGLVFLEAAACACPAIAGDAGGTGDAIEDGITGLRVDGTNSETVTAAIARLLDQPHLAEKMAQAGRQRAVNEFAWERVAEKTLLMEAPRGLD